jgi:hypothetical protein
MFQGPYKETSAADSSIAEGQHLLEEQTQNTDICLK